MIDSVWDQWGNKTGKRSKAGTISGMTVEDRRVGQCAPANTTGCYRCAAICCDNTTPHGTVGSDICEGVRNYSG